MAVADPPKPKRAKKASRLPKDIPGVAEFHIHGEPQLGAVTRERARKVKEQPALPPGVEQASIFDTGHVHASDLGVSPGLEPLSGRKPRSAKKKQSRLPDGIEQLAFFSSLTPVAPIVEARKPARQRKMRNALPEGVTQPDIFSLIATDFDEAALDPAIKTFPELKPQLTPKAQVTLEQQPDIGQISIDEMLAVSSAEAEIPVSLILQPQPAKEEKLGVAQLTIDDILAGLPDEAEIAPIPALAQTIIDPPKEEIADEQSDQRQPDQPYLELLAKSPASNAGAIPEGEQAGGGTGSDSNHVRRSAVRTGSNTENEPSGSVGDSNQSNLSARTRRRIILDEPERRSSRDLRITPEHRVGSGSLKEKAEANIAAIRLLKAIEADNREATEDEKAVLVKYAGWGALAGCFEPWRLDKITQRTNHEWQTVIAGELKELLTEEEYTDARATTPNAHFTSPMVVSTIWQGLEKLGVGKAAEILEPSMGIGHFFGLMPESLQGGHRTGVELDSVTARIARQLYPDATIFHKGFEDTPLPDNYFDVAVGNVPFGDYGVHDPEMKPRLRSSIHDYFFAKSLEKVRLGGMMALVTSHYTMDKKDSTVRKHLAEQADLVAAIRLPNTAFKDNAGTQVTTDILFLKKRAVGEEAGGEDWTETSMATVEGHQVPLNEYYVRHPEMMLGEMKLTRGMYRDLEPTLTGDLTTEKLQGALKTLPKAIYTPRDQGRSPPQRQTIPPVTPEAFIGVKDGAYAIVNGQIVIRNGATFSPAALTAANAARVRGQIAIRDAVREVFRTQLDDEPEARIVAARQELNRLYDQFLKQHGPLSGRDNYRAFANDPDQPLLLSLENYNAETKTATKTAIFERRTLARYKPVEHVETAAEALAISLNETGNINWDRIANLTGSSVREAQVELSGQVYENPSGVWETADQYLSGNVRAKLWAAEAAAEINPAYRSNAEALRAVQPADIPPGEINARLGAGWIPREDIRDFICQLLNTAKGDVIIGHASEIATWSIALEDYAERFVANTTTYGTKRMKASELIEMALNMRTPTIYDHFSDGTSAVNQGETIAAREAQQKLKDRFAKWIWEDPERTERLTRLYNDKFNNIRLRTYDGSHLSLPGMNRTGLRNNDLDPHQKNAVWRILQNKNTLIGHVVGAGKTASMTTSAMELKRLGLASKSMIVVPNHLVEQWGSEFLKLYPEANIFVAGKEHFTTGNREKAMARIATGNYDAVIISHKSFESLPVSAATFKRFVGKEIASLEQAILEASSEKSDNRSIIKSLEKAKKRLETKIMDRARREKKDDGVTWEQLGIDRIFVDEADLFKNLGFTTKMNRIAGLPNTESNRALDMYMKTQYLNERGGGTVFATGTPISNTMAEMYTIMRYLAPEVLKAAGVEHFDAWSANFGEAVTALELAPDGSGYRMHTRFAKFVNMPELLSMFRSFADIQTADMLNLPRPEIEGGKARIVAAPASPELKKFVEALVERAERVRSGKVDPRSDNMLKITTDGRKAALDMRIVGRELDDAFPTKVSMAIDNVSRIWREGKGEQLTQAVFCDLSTPGDGFNVYHDIRNQLIERGVPAKEIAFIHDADTDIKKKALFDAVNAGRVRILLGSTEKMGAGTNIQKRLVALHHLDAPWRPRDVEQRDGRILRQGNENKNIQIYRYVTEGSFDAYMWQTLETKQRFIEQVMNGRTSVREAEDLESGALSFAEIKAIASGNPAVLEKVKLDTEIRKLDMLRTAHLNQQYEINKQVGGLPKQIEEGKVYHAGLLDDNARYDANKKASKGEFIMTVEGRTFSGEKAREKAGEALISAILADKHDQTLRRRGEFAGFEILSRGSKYENINPDLYICGKNKYEAKLNPESALGTVASIEYSVRHLGEIAEEQRHRLERMEKSLSDYKSQLNIPFEHEAKLRELLIKQQGINHQLDLDKGDSQAAMIAPDINGEVSKESAEGIEKAKIRQEVTAEYSQSLSSNTDKQINSDTDRQPDRRDVAYEESKLTQETVNLFSTPRVVEGLKGYVVGAKSPIRCIIICESEADAMSYYQLSKKPGHYIVLGSQFSDKREDVLRRTLTSSPQVEVITATNATVTGEKYAVLVKSMHSNAIRARPSLPGRRDIKYESWNDVRMDKPMQSDTTPQPSQQTDRERQPGAAHEIAPSVTPVNWGNRGRIAIPPADIT